jgi:hypothetical protein
MSGTAAHPPGPDDIPDDAELWRRIPPRHYPQGDGRTWPSSAAFEDPPNGTWMSVFIASECRDYNLLLADYPDFGLVSLTARQVRECGLEVVRKPMEGQPPGHSEVVGKKTDSIRKKLAKACRWVVR